MIFTLCCLFHEEDIKFKTYNKNASQEKALEVCSYNVLSLKKAIQYCEDNSIFSYRVTSDLFPHADSFENLPYKDLPKQDKIIFSMHPGQHVNMGSPHQSVIESSVSDIKYHLKMSEYLNNNEINIHLGGAYNNKENTKKRFIENMQRYFTLEELSKITIENDELNFHVLDVYEVCKELNIRPVFDIHHHRCHQLKDKINITEEEIFELYSSLWLTSKQRLHLSNPKPEIGYLSASKSRPHSDLIYDFPDWLKDKDVIIDIEAKYKEVAIFNLIDKLSI